MGVSQPYKELGNATDMYSITGLHLPTKKLYAPRWVNGNPRRCLFVLHGVHANGGTRRKRSRWGFGVRPIVHQAIARSSYFICCSAIFILWPTPAIALLRQRGGIEPPAYLYAPGVEVQSEYQPDSPWPTVKLC